jgi:hypothetical protein
MESVYAGLTRQQQLLNHGPGDKKRPWSQSEDAARKALVDKPELAKKNHRGHPGQTRCGRS